MKIRICTICGTEFESRNGKQVCSESCRLERNCRTQKGISVGAKGFLIFLKYYKMYYSNPEWRKAHVEKVKLKKST